MCRQVSSYTTWTVINYINFISDHMTLHISFIGPTCGAVLGDPRSSCKVTLGSLKQEKIQGVERTTTTPEKLARGLLAVLLSPEELARGNCTKPVRPDIKQLDTERLWGIKCKNLYLALPILQLGRKSVAIHC